MSTLTKAGRYDLREELGRGAMGVVYHGFDPVIGRDVAVKTLRLSEAGTGLSREELVGRFQTEARAAGLLTHPNIVVVFDAGEQDGLFYITMEFVEGRSLQSLIDTHQPLPVARVLKFMEQICSALDFAHQHNVVHRDIKPANLMLTADDIIKITDFGTAKILQFGTAQTAHVMGTPSYMSPEQVKGKPVDGRSDIFSLGVILYELMTGEKPFPGQNITTVIYKIINEEPVSPRSLDSTIHPGLSSVITRALAKEPSARYQSCHELLSALKNYHDMTGPETTARMSPVTAQPSHGSSRPEAQPARSTALPTASSSQVASPPANVMLAVPMEEEGSRTPGKFLLTLALLGVIGYSGYRVYPPALDLWRRSHDAVEGTAAPAKAEVEPQASNPDNSGSTPDTQTSDVAQTATPAVPAAVPAPVPAPAPRVAATPVERTSAPNASRPSTAAAPAALKATLPAAASRPSASQPSASTPSAPARPAPADASGANKAAAPQQPAVPEEPSAAHLLETRLRAEISGQPIADKVKFQATANALTLSGSLTIAEHRELLRQLRPIPPGVRIIDDIDLTETVKEAPAAAATAAGWVWVRSTPPGARIIVDGTETGLRTPARLELRAGEHDLGVVREGFEMSHRSVQVNSGETQQVSEALNAE